MPKSIMELPQSVNFCERGAMLVSTKPKVVPATCGKGAAKRGKITSFSCHSAARLREALLTAKLKDGGEYYTVAVCLTVPMLDTDFIDGGRSADDVYSQFSKSLHLFCLNLQNNFPSIGGLWRIELTVNRMPHAHLFLLCPRDVLTSAPLSVYSDGHKYSPDFYTAKWVDNLLAFELADGLPPHLRRRFRSWKTWVKNGKVMTDFGALVFGARDIVQCALVEYVRKNWRRCVAKFGDGREMRDGFDVKGVDIRLVCRDASLSYLCDHTSKHKEEQLGWQGRQWGYVNRPALVFDYGETIRLTAPAMARLLRTFRRYRDANCYHFKVPYFASGKFSFYRFCPEFERLTRLLADNPRYLNPGK